MPRTISDIVPQGVLLKIANRIANSARGFAKGTGSKRIPKSIKVGKVSATKDTASITIWLDTNIAPQAVIFERGAKEHGIDAKNFPTLQFNGTNGYPLDNPGGIIRIAHVNHPGMEKRPFLQPAKDKHREQNRQELREAVGRNIRLVIRGLARKV